MGAHRGKEPVDAGASAWPAVRMLGTDDAEALAEFLTSQEWPLHTAGRPTRDVILERVLAGYYNSAHTSTYAVLDDGRVVAMIRLEDLQDDTAMFDVRVSTARRSQGLGTHLVMWATGHVFSSYPAAIRVEAVARRDNISMRRVLRRCGYVKESHYRASWPDAGGRLLDAVGYAVLRQDWESGTTTPVEWDDET